MSHLINVISWSTVVTTLKRVKKHKFTKVETDVNSRKKKSFLVAPVEGSHINRTHLHFRRLFHSWALMDVSGIKAASFAH